MLIHRQPRNVAAQDDTCYCVNFRSKVMGLTEHVADCSIRCDHKEQYFVVRLMFASSAAGCPQLVGADLMSNMFHGNAELM